MRFILLMLLRTFQSIQKVLLLSIVTQTSEAKKKKMTKYKLFLKYDSVRQKFYKQSLKPNDKQEKIYLEL